ncbi:MAG: VCBS repeat-containing protein [Blastocatellia bacterium]|nr:VCBS repeat-containing protein [Blastocatellia bacterium]
MFAQAFRRLSMMTAAIYILTAVCVAQSTGVDATFNAVPSSAISGNGVSQYLVQSDGKVIVFGPRLVSNGVAKGDIVRLNTDGTVDSTFDYCGCADISFDNIKLAPDGKLLLGGATQAAAKIVRLNQNGSIDLSFNTPTYQANSTFIIDAIQADGKVFATRRNSFQGFVSFTLFRFNADGSQDAGFTPISYASGSPVFGYVRLALLSDGKFYMGVTAGNFGSSAQLTRRNNDGTVDPTWETPSIATAGFPSQTSIADIAVQADGSLLVAGRWDTVNGLSKNHFVKLLPAGNVDVNFTGPFSIWGTGVKTLPDGKILYSANIDIAGIVRVYRLNPDGSTDALYNMDASITSILGQWNIDNLQRVVLQGSSANGPRLFRLQTNGTIDSSFTSNLSFYGTVNTLARQADGKVLIAGVYSQMNGVNRSSFARVNTDGTLDATFDIGTGFSSPPDSLVIQSDGKIIAIGEFTSYNGTSVPGIVRLNSNGSIDSSFSLTVTGTIRAAAIRPDGKIYVVGEFSNINGAARTSAALLNADGTIDSSFAPNIGGFSRIYAIAVQPDGKVVIGGQFAGVNGFNRNNFARLNPDGSLDQSFNPSVSSLGKIWLQPDGKFIIGIGTTISQIDRRNSDGSDDTTFTPAVIAASSSSDTEIRTVLIQPDGSYLVSGRFDFVGGLNRSNFARLTSNGSVDQLFPTNGANSRVRSMIADTDGKAIIGGDFAYVLGLSRPGVARLNIAPLRDKTPFDFDGDGRADFSVFRPSTNQWYELFYGGSTFVAPVFGQAGDIPVPADFDGDGKTDEAIFRPSNGQWWYQSSINNAQLAVQYGVSGDIPLPGDVDLDGRAEFIVFRPSNSTWYRSTSLGPLPSIPFGQAGDKPLIGDFDGDGKVDPAIFRPSTGDWWYAASSAGNQHRATRWGLAGDVPAPADYDGDNKTDHAVFRPSTGVWYIINSSNGSFTILPFGSNGDRPISADYDGDGRADIAVFRPSTGIWYLLQSTSGFSGAQWGVASDVAIPSAFAQF